MKTSNISWSILAAAGLVVTSLVLASCSTCPAVQKDSIE
jgi:predicted small secreted protein